MVRTSCFMILSITMLTGCIQSSGTLPLGPDTYTLSVHAAPVRGAAGARKEALTEASEFCHSQKKDLMVTNIVSGSSGSLPGDNVDITFRCLRYGDADLHRPVYESAPTVIIQNR